MLFRQLFDRDSCTYSYLLADERSREAVLIDPVFEHHQRDIALLRELDLKLILALDTHVHADHVTGAWLLKQAVGSEIGLSQRYEAENVDVGFYEGEEIELAPLLHERMLLCLPTTPLCDEACRGLCPRCGSNLNHESCSCEADAGDPRLAVFRTLKVRQ